MIDYEFRALVKGITTTKRSKTQTQEDELLIVGRPKFLVH
jgi:hypothetical protein